MNTNLPLIPKSLNILLIEDDVNLAEQLSYFLEKRGFNVSLSRSIQETLHLLNASKYDTLILDRLLPDGDSLNWLNKIKQSHQGKVILLSALGRVTNRIEGYQAGADIYLAKPVNPDELLAILINFTQSHQSARLENNNWHIKHHKLITPQNVSIHLTSREYLIVETLIKNTPEVVLKEKIIQTIGVNSHGYDTRSLDTTIYRIRNKIKEATIEKIPIVTHHGLGYSWE
ncbi:response regulator transcription factor [Thiomicrospira microaerophila]|uniref:response regulator transcription factor n=1 Tax=Thiomicrospira microaerophila TaxID=406020 RepID=UPI0005CA218C|nr:response regulator transcription factor [Thiomicrospira microaerophila]